MSSSDTSSDTSSDGARSLLDYFQDLEDPRMDRRKAHPLVNVLFIAVCAVLSGAEGWRSIETFGEAKKRWLAQYLNLPEGPRPVPSDDTYRRTISRLDPEAFEEVFRAWVASLMTRIDGEVIALDGKSLRGSRDRDETALQEHGVPKKPLHLVSAWASEQRLVLAQQAVDAKTNEITVLPDLLEMLELDGCLVTIDAMGTQKTIADQIHEEGGDYVLALKSNHKRLYDDVKTHFDGAVDCSGGRSGADSGPSPLAPSHDCEVDGGHGRVEVRQCWATDDIRWLDRRDQWPGLQSPGCKVLRWCRRRGKNTSGTRKRASASGRRRRSGGTT